MDRRQPGGGGGRGARRITAGGGRDILLLSRALDGSSGAGPSTPISLALSSGTPLPAGVFPVGNRGGSSALQQGTASYYTSGTAVSGGLGCLEQSAQLRAVALRLLTAIVVHVRLENDIFDDILDVVVAGAPQDLLADSGGNPCGGSELRHALEGVNADAVRLARYRLGGISPPPETPRPVEESVFQICRRWDVPRLVSPWRTGGGSIHEREVDGKRPSSGRYYLRFPWGALYVQADKQKLGQGMFYRMLFMLAIGGIGCVLAVLSV